jgi:hypothetical protein
MSFQMGTSGGLSKVQAHPAISFQVDLDWQSIDLSANLDSPFVFVLLLLEFCLERCDVLVFISFPLELAHNPAKSRVIMENGSMNSPGRLMSHTGRSNEQMVGS